MNTARRCEFQYERERWGTEIRIPAAGGKVRRTENLFNFSNGLQALKQIRETKHML